MIGIVMNFVFNVMMYAVKNFEHIGKMMCKKQQMHKGVHFIGKIKNSEHHPHTHHTIMNIIKQSKSMFELFSCIHLSVLMIRTKNERKKLKNQANTWKLV